MSRKIAVKKLKPSDLSFFHSYLTKHPQTKQKAFNLDRSVMEGQFFPSLSILMENELRKAAIVDLTFFGPGAAEGHSLTRKIKREAKNIRLNGEVVSNPAETPTRYDILEPDDFAVMDFAGDSLPRTVKIVLIAANHPEDATMHAGLNELFPTGSMRLVSEDEITQVITTANPSLTHPIRDWLDSRLIEEIGSGSETATERLNARRPSRGLSAAELSDAKASAAKIGQKGEELLNQFLSLNSWPSISSYEWIAQTNAISPFDFRLTTSSGVERHIDAKSTSGDFSRSLFLSIAEIQHAINSGVPYDICRIYNLTESSAKFRVARDIAQCLNPVINALRSMPNGVVVESMSFSPTFFNFEPEEHLIETSD